MSAKRTNAPDRSNHRKGRTSKDKLRVKERRCKVAEMTLRDQSQQEIGRQLGVSQSTISSDILAIQADWQKAAQKDINKRNARNLALIDHAKAHLINAWCKSTAGTEKTTKTSGSKGGSDFFSQTHSIDQSYGNPQFLAQLKSLIELENQITGINAALKMQDINEAIRVVIAQGYKITDFIHNELI